MQNQRENWGSRTGFILAAIGSAVGLGNVWRFPHEAYSNGGSAFLIPYIVAMLIIGIPLLIMEFSLGHLTQQAAPGAFKKVGPRWEFVGWWPIILSFIIVCYYAVVLAWCLNYLVKSFSNPLPWSQQAFELAHASPQEIHTAAKTYYFNKFLQFTGNMSLGGLRWPIVASLAVVWLGMYLSIFKGVKIVSKIVLWTVPIPWVMLLILMIRGLTLKGAIQGLEYYLEPDWQVLADPQVWRAAFGQVFFSMTIAFGVMITYASFLHRKSDLNNNALIIGLADLGTSFIAGIAVFSTMGALAVKTGQPVSQVLEGSQSVGLAFVAFPEALAKLPLANLFSCIFFIALLLLGIDSAFSITEAALASMIDKTGWKRTSILAVMSLMGFTIGLLFTTRGGLSWLGTIDSFINEGTWGILFVGLIECLVLGWVFDIRKLRAHTNKNSDWQLGVWWEWAIRLVIPVILASLVIWSFIGDIRGPAMTLSSDDVKAPAKLVVLLKKGDDAVSRYVQAQLSPQTQQLLTGYTDGQPSTELIQALIKDLNRVLTGQSIYDKQRFAGIQLQPETTLLLSQAGTKQDTLRLNRWLLQDAYPDILSKSANRGGFFVDFTGQLIGRNVLGMCLTFMVFLVAVILALWQPNKTARLVEFDT